MTENQEKQVMTMLTRTIKGIEDLREGQSRLENRMENVENELVIVKNDLTDVKTELTDVKTEVKVINKKMSNYSNDVAELRARVEILEERILSVN